MIERNESMPLTPLDAPQPTSAGTSCPPATVTEEEGGEEEEEEESTRTV
jgi:hypothetical protein